MSLFDSCSTSQIVTSEQTDEQADMAKLANFCSSLPNLPAR
jgi:hypothetical protein